MSTQRKFTRSVSLSENEFASKSMMNKSTVKIPTDDSVQPVKARDDDCVSQGSQGNGQLGNVGKRRTSKFLLMMLY